MLVLLGGEPGWKIDITTPVALLLYKVLYILGEESDKQIRMRETARTQRIFLSYFNKNIFQQIIAVQPDLLVVDSFKPYKRTV